MRVQFSSSQNYSKEKSPENRLEPGKKKKKVDRDVYWYISDGNQPHVDLKSSWLRGLPSPLHMCPTPLSLWGDPLHKGCRCPLPAESIAMEPTSADMT